MRLPALTAQPAALGYRPDIDGLRAVAISGVLAYHLRHEALPGGFAGVDVFFVISGFLITRILVAEIVAGRFSLLGFWARRVRRILPALLAMILGTTLLAAAVMVPPALRVYGASAVAATLSASNFYFWYAADYHAIEAYSRPLLHTWSLAVEEQYYLLFPPFLLLAHRRWRNWAVPLLALAGASFALSVALAWAAPPAGFYLLPARFWELALGSVLALGLVPAAGRQGVAEALAVAGLGLIAASYLLLDDHTPYPGFHAAAPCLGAALAIHAGQHHATWVGRLLGRPLPVFLGLISYSLYLWHWPLIVLPQSFVLQRPLQPAEIALVLAATLAAALLSWRLVERPFRRHGRDAAPLRALLGGGAAAAAMAALGAALFLGQGWPGRFAPETLRLALASRDINPDRRDCDARPVADIRTGRVCRIGAEGVAPTFALVGDSFGDAIVPGLAEAARRAGKAGLVLTWSGCNPLFAIAQSTAPGCRAVLDAIAEHLRATPALDTVVLAARWTRIAEGTRFGVIQAEASYITDDQSTEQSFAENRRVFARALARTLHELRGRKLVVVAYFPEQAVNVPQAAFIDALLGRSHDFGVPRAVYEARQAFVRATLADLALQERFAVIDVGRVFCDADRCWGVRGGEPYYSDDNHLTGSAVRAQSRIFDPIFAGAARAGPG